MVKARRLTPESSTTGIQILVLAPISCVTLGMLVNILESQFSLKWNNSAPTLKV